jgi:hypothetical protein
VFEGFLGAVPVYNVAVHVYNVAVHVYNVAVHVTGRDFWIFELGETRPEPLVEKEPEPPAV